MTTWQPAANEPRHPHCTCADDPHIPGALIVADDCPIHVRVGRAYLEYVLKAEVSEA
jgi:hypothetical protein